MKLNEFYRLAAERARELGTENFTVEVSITSLTGRWPEIGFICYMPQAGADRLSRYETPENALRSIGALPPLEIDDDTELEDLA